MNRAFFSGVLFLAILLFFQALAGLPANCCAEDAIAPLSGIRGQAAAAAPKNAQPEQAPALIDMTRKNVQSATEWAARGIDSWFGDKPFEDGGKVTGGRIRMRTVWREHQDIDVSARFRVNMKLPNMQDKVDVLLGSENEADLIRDRPDSVIEQQRLLHESKDRDETLFAGLGLRLLDQVRLHVGLRDLSRPYLKLRYEKEWLLPGTNRFFFQETPYWALNEGLGETTTMEFEHAFSPVLSVRWLCSGTLAEEERGLDWSHSLGIFRSFTGQRQASGEALANGKTGTGVDVREYGFLVKWRQPVWREWLLGEVSAGHYWYKKDSGAGRESQWALGVGLQMNF